MFSRRYTAFQIKVPLGGFLPDQHRMQFQLLSLCVVLDLFQWYHEKGQHIQLPVLSTPVEQNQRFRLFLNAAKVSSLAPYYYSKKLLTGQCSECTSVMALETVLCFGATLCLLEQKNVEGKYCF